MAVVEAHLGAGRLTHTALAMGKNQEPALRTHCTRVGVGDGQPEWEWVAATHACRAVTPALQRAYAIAFGLTDKAPAQFRADDHTIDLTWMHGLFCTVGMNAARKANHLSSGASITADDEVLDLFEDFVSVLRASACHDADCTADLCDVLAEAGDSDQSDRDFVGDFLAATAADMVQVSGSSADAILSAIRARHGHGANNSPRGDATLQRHVWPPGTSEPAHAAARVVDVARAGGSPPAHLLDALRGSQHERAALVDTCAAMLAAAAKPGADAQPVACQVCPTPWSST